MAFQSVVLLQVSVMQPYYRLINQLYLLIVLLGHVIHHNTYTGPITRLLLTCLTSICLRISLPPLRAYRCALKLAPGTSKSAFLLSCNISNAEQRWDLTLAINMSTCL